MYNIIKLERHKLKKNLKKSMAIISEEYCNHDLYKENYDFLKHLPFVRELIRTNKKLVNENDNLKEINQKLNNLLYTPKPRRHKKTLYSNLENDLQHNDDVVDLPVDDLPVVDLPVVDLPVDDLPVDDLQEDIIIKETLPNIKYELIEQDEIKSEVKLVVVKLEKFKQNPINNEVEIVEHPRKTPVQVEIESDDEDDESAQEEQQEEDTQQEDQQEEEEDQQEEDTQQEEEEEEEDPVPAPVQEEQEEEEEESDAPAPVQQEEEEEEDQAEEEEEDQAEEEEEESEVYEITIKNKTYYTTSEENGTIYADINGEVGDEVGVFKNRKAIFT